MPDGSSATGEAALVLNGVSHAYDHVVLRQLSLTVEAKTIVAVVGPSGSGKSTLLSIAGLLLTPDHGSVLISGSAVTRQRRLTALREIGWVFQTTNALGRRTAADNVAQPLLAVGWRPDDADRRARRVLARLGLEALADQRASDCSGGELQRVCIARALAGRPALIVADEPTGQLDADTSRLVIDTLVAARHLGASILLATHDMAVAACADVRYDLAHGILS